MNLTDKKKRILAIILSMGLSASAFAAVSAGATDLDSGELVRVEPEAYSTIPQGARHISVNMNGRRVLEGKVFNYNKITYVPMKAFADWLGMYEHTLDYGTSTATLTGTNLKITAHEGDLYITANGRHFYTGEPVMLFGGVMYVPILPIVKALNAKMEWNGEENTFYIRSGDSRLLKSAEQVYRSDEVFWLARIITAEAQGESMNGKIAVGNVVLNRVKSEQFPNTIYSVIFDKKYGVQFSPVSNGTIYNTPTEESIIAAKICLEGYTLSDKILYFVNPKAAPNSWMANNRPYAFTIGNHSFFE